MPIALIAAVSDNNCIGKNGSLPWNIPEDMKRFKEITRSKIVIMGRKTWESIPEKFRPLPHRLNVVITRQIDYPLPVGVERYNSIDEALTRHAADEVMVIGGAEIYAQTIDRADTLYITRIHQHVDGDAFFPAIDLHHWHEASREDHPEFSFLTYTKK